ncbi:MAG: hypothetical protein OHK0040_05790 [bacterium]
MELTDYLNANLKSNYKPIMEPNYTIATRMLAYKEVDIAFLCSGPFVIGKERYGIEPIAAIKPSHGMEYRSYIIVPADSKATSLKELKGKRFAFVDLQSYTGRLVPLYMIKKMGEDPATFFSEVVYTKSHEASLFAVAERKVDGAGVISLLLEHELRTNPELKKKIKIIDKSKNTGFPVFATVKYSSNGDRERFKNTLLNMHKDPKGKEILKKLEIERFFEPKDSEYELIRQQYKEVKEFVP